MTRESKAMKKRTERYSEKKATAKGGGGGERISRPVPAAATTPGAFRITASDDNNNAGILAVPPLTALSESISAPVIVGIATPTTANNNRNDSRISYPGAYRMAPGGDNNGVGGGRGGTAAAPVVVPELAPTTLTATTSASSQNGFIPMTALTESTSAPQQSMMTGYYERLRMEKLQQQQQQQQQTQRGQGQQQQHVPAPSRFPPPPAANTALYRGQSNESDNTSGNRPQQQLVGDEQEQRIQRRYRRRLNQELETATKKLRSRPNSNGGVVVGGGGGGGRGSDVGLQNPQMRRYHQQQQQQPYGEEDAVTIAVDYGDGTEYALNFSPDVTGTTSGGNKNTTNNYTNRVMNSAGAGAGAGGAIPEERRSLSRRFFGVPSTYPDFDGEKDADSKRRTLLRNICIIGIVFVLIAATVVIVLKFAINKDDDGDSKGGAGATTVDGGGVFGDEFEDRRRSSLFIIRNVITPEHYDAIVNHVNNNGLVDDNSSEGVEQLPQYLAWEWIVTKDNLSPISESSTSQIEVFATRYTLVLFYYYMHGPDWSVQPNWLDGGGDVDTCAWTFVSCSDKAEDSNVDAGRVEVLNVTANNLSGSIPMELHQLSHLGK